MFLIPLSFIPGKPLPPLNIRTDDDALDSSGESPPNDFTVSPSISPPQSFIASTTAVEFAPKRGKSGTILGFMSS